MVFHSLRRIPPNRSRRRRILRVPLRRQWRRQLRTERALQLLLQREEYRYVRARFLIFYLTFFSVCVHRRARLVLLSLSLSLCSERGGRAVFWRFLARYSAFLSPSHACDLLAFLSLIERQGRISSNCKSSWRATLAE